VKIIVYNVLGKEIAVPVNENQQAGKHEIVWDGTNYPSGIYFYTLKSGDYSETKKMILIK
jgi:hypothetical protein